MPCWHTCRSTGWPGNRDRHTGHLVNERPTRRRPMAGRSPARRRRPPMVTAPDGWEANHAVLAHLSEHRVPWRG